LQDAAEVLFRFSVAVLHRSVELVPTGGKRLSDDAPLVERIAANHQSADRAAAEAKNRKPHAGAAKRAHFHDRSSARFAQHRTSIGR
jgi:hypothetical protein